MFRLLASIATTLRRKIELLGYDANNMADYLRKQGAQVGNHCRIYINDLGSEPFLVKIGNHVTIPSGVCLVTHDGGCWVFRDEIPDLNCFGKIEIEDNCFIGVNAIILPNVTVGRNSIIGAGSVVAKSIPAGSVAAGVPARVIGTIEEYRTARLREWRELNLSGDRRDWKDQLTRHFWK